MKTTERSAQVTIYLSPEVKQKLREEAAKVGLTLSTYLSMVLAGRKERA